MKVSQDLAEEHYGEHKARPFGELVEFITSSPVVAMVWEGDNAITLCRTLMGATKAEEALQVLFAVILPSTQVRI